MNGSNSSEDQWNFSVWRELLIRHFNTSELQDLCFDLGIPYESLSGQNFPDKVRELLAFAQRDDLTGELFDMCRRLRPKAEWHKARQPKASGQTPQPEQPKSTPALSSLEIRIEGRQAGSSLDVPGLRGLWQNTFGGTLELGQQRQNLYTFSWQASDDGPARIRDYDKHGGLDQKLAPKDEFRVLEMTQDGECLYQYIPPLPPLPIGRAKDASIAEMQAVASQIDVLVMTVTDTERAAFLPFLKPLPGQRAVLRGAISDITYRFGKFGRYGIAHVESTMGGGGRQGATLTAEKAISELKPKALILLGIAFGVNRKKQRLGDVIVAEAVSNYELQRVSANETIYRGEQVQCSNILSERFRMRRDDWELPCGTHRNVSVHQGLMLSGSKVMDNKEDRDRLLAAFPAALGGEMEGAGAYAAATGRKTEVILIKAICDWADGEKNDRAQPFAAYAAVHLAAHVLSKPDVLTSLGAVDLGLPDEEE